MQSVTSISKLRQQLRSLDWSLLKGSALMTAGSLVARALAMLFWLLLARTLTPDSYGSVQYAITLGGLIALGTHPFGQHVMARYVAKYRQNTDELRVYLGNSWIIMGVLVLVSLAVGVPLLLITGRFDFGVLAVFLGLTAFFTYWGIATGFEAPGRLTLAYLGCNLAQLVVTVIVIWAFNITSPIVMTIIYGMSYAVPVIVVQLFRPFPIMLSALRPDRAALKSLLLFFGPVWISHGSYILYTDLPVLLLEHFAGKNAVGVFSLANTLTAIFGIVGLSVSTLFLPKAASLNAQERGRQLRNIVVVMLVVNGVMLAGYGLTVGWFVNNVFGAEYLSSLSTYIVLAVATICLGIQGLISSSLIGGGQVRLDAIFRIISLVVTATCGWLLIPQMAELGASLAILAGTGGVVFIYPLVAYLSRRNSRNAQAEG